MPRYIDVTALDTFDYSIFDGRLTEDAVQGMETVLNCIDKIPTSDVQEVKHGEWVSHGLGYEWVYQCSECGWVDGHLFNNRFNYCPHCGADMRGEK